MCISNSENKVYLHNIHWTEDRVNETNMQQTEADVDNADSYYSEVDNNEHLQQIETQHWITQLQTYIL